MMEFLGYIYAPSGRRFKYYSLVEMETLLRLGWTLK